MPDTDPLTRLRGLRAEAPRRTVGPGFADAVHARVRRRRARVRSAGAAVLAAAVVLGVVIPLRIASPQVDGGAATNVDAQPGDTPGGFAVTWLPDGVRLKGNGRATLTSDGKGGSSSGDAEVPYLGAQKLYELGRTTFVSQFTTPQDDEDYRRGHGFTRVTVTPTACADGPPCQPTSVWSMATLSPAELAARPNPASVWVSVTWRPDTVITQDAVVARAENFINRLPPDMTMHVARDTVGGRPAVLLNAVGATHGHYYYYDTSPDRDHSAALIWTTPDGVALAVEVAGTTPADPAVLHRIADGVGLHQMPPIANYTPPAYPPALPDAATTSAVTTAVTDAFTGTTPTDRWVAAVRDGPRLLSTRELVADQLPRFAQTVTVQVFDLVQVGPDIVTAHMTVSSDDPNAVPTSGPHGMRNTDGSPVDTSALDFEVTVVHTAAGWQVNADNYCRLISNLNVSGLDC
ncbi:hypothetical protein [Pseudofrankia asymbiotica]|uniref:Uncharacterized protein n=1 Tax=Pseudofrankia asymbiotica TaxID=1834516 RepID=A0A1V2IHY1_9ACTN|nr:hypothetical protein [Pseudofrankia asymbiotica]ONH32802.1 hypothetical protein BL253_03445 [Pseudofrankia asymbiotica]